MSGLCLAAAALTVALPVQSFTLAWTHSIEKIRWEEDYRIVSQGKEQRLDLVEARIRGSGAGMEPPDGAVLKDGVWHYRPDIAPLSTFRITRSPYTVDYTLCWDGRCHPMAELLGPATTVSTVDVSVCPPR